MTSPPQAKSENHLPTPLVLDVDTGVDDALALLLAIRCPYAEVLAVSCVAGNADVEKVVDNTLRVLEAAAAPTKLPVGAGFDLPLVEPARRCPQIHGEDGLGDLRPPLPRASIRTAPNHAVEVLQEALRSAPTPVTVVALAPLTNIAASIRMEPVLWREKASRIVWMGGAVSAGGNHSAWAEANAAYDPEAAHIVLTSGVPLMIYPWDVYVQVTYTAEELEALGIPDVDSVSCSTSTRSPWSLLAGRLLHRELRHFGEGFCGLGDAGAVAAALLPDSLTLRRLHVTSELRGIATRGMSACDLRGTVWPPDLPKGDPNADVVVAVDAGRIKELFSRWVLEAEGSKKDAQAIHKEPSICRGDTQQPAKRQRVDGMNCS